MSDAPTLSPVETNPGERVRACRVGAKLNLEEFADRIRDLGFDRPSTAKLSRIETGVQPVSLDILPALSELTGIPRRQLRPDLAERLNEAAE